MRSLLSSAVRLLAAGACLGVAAVQAQSLNYTTPYTVATLAGGGGFGSSGFVNDTGLNARFFDPYGVAVDSSGNVYVADGKNNAVREITPGGTVTTYATSVNSGTNNGLAFGVLGGIAIDSSGNLYVTDHQQGALYKITPGGVCFSLLSPGQLNNPYGVALDSSGNIYIADTGNYIIRKLTTGGTFSILAGSIGSPGITNATGTSAQFEYPVGVAVDASGNVYVTDNSADLIRLVTPGGSVSTYTGQATSPTTNDGSLGAAGTANPLGIAIDSSGTIYFTDTNHLLRKISGGVVSTLAGSYFQGGGANGTGSAAFFSFASPAAAGVAVDSSGNLYIADTNNNDIRKAVPAGVAPSITTQPQSQTVAIGGSANFTVVASGPGTLSYQWNFNGNPLSGATSSSYTLTNAQTSNAGSYTVGVTNSSGTTTSNVALLTVNTPPSITTQPQSQTATAGAPVTLTVAATGTAPLSYQWNLNGSAISGATASSYAISSVQLANAGNYTVTVSNGAGTVTSGAAVLTVNAPPSITTQPQSQTIGTGGSVTFSVAASGTAPLSYQWSFNSATLSGATSSSYSISSVQASNAGSYQVSITNLAGLATSSAAVLTVSNGPVIATQPQSQTVLDGSNATLSVAASGTGLSYQWYYNGAAIAGATSSTLALNSLSTIQGGGSYYVVVTNGNGSTASNTVNVGVTYNARLVDISIISTIQSSLSMGFVTGGIGTTGSSNVLVRAVGPALSAFNEPNILPDPTLNVVRQSDHSLVGSDTGWGNPATNVSVVEAADLATGAFALTNPSSLDSALVANLPDVNGGYSAVVAGKSGDSGNALTEVYDDSSTNYVAGVTPRLVNLSCLTQLAAGSSLTVGFVIGGPSGASSETVLIRVTGPALAGLGVSGGMPDPQLSLSPLGSSTVLAANAGWGANAAAVTAADNLTGAFALNNTVSKDSATVVTLAPGGYTVQVSSVSGAAGAMLVEIYEVP